MRRKLTTDEVARMKACEGIYSIGDVAHYFGVSKTTVHYAWSGKRHSEIEAADDIEDIPTSRVRREVIEEDAPVYLARGYDYDRTAEALGISKRTLYRYLATA